MSPEKQALYAEQATLSRQMGQLYGRQDELITSLGATSAELRELRRRLSKNQAAILESTISDAIAAQGN